MAPRRFVILSVPVVVLRVAVTQFVTVRIYITNYDTRASSLPLDVAPASHDPTLPRQLSDVLQVAPEIGT